MLPYGVFFNVVPSLTSTRRIAAMIAIALAAAQCGGGPSAPSGPALAITCPAAQTVASLNGTSAAVTFAAPTITGGTGPITTTCGPLSGAQFGVGPTTVTCNAVDAKQQTASCTFTVTVTAPPRVSATRFVAFGDSITEGFPQTSIPLFIPNPPDSYPAFLEAMLKARYTAQVDAIAVLDEGVGGERTDEGIVRLANVLIADSPGALLLMEGANDLNALGSSGVLPTVNGLRGMIRVAKNRSVPVFIATLLPQRRGGSRAGSVDLVVPANDAIRAMVAAEGGILVDLYQAFGGTPDPLIASDGLHPNAAGNQKIAQTFFDVIRGRLEATGSSSLSW